MVVPHLSPTCHQWHQSTNVIVSKRVTVPMLAEREPGLLPFTPSYWLITIMCDITG